MRLLCSLAMTRIAFVGWSVPIACVKIPPYGILAMFKELKNVFLNLSIFAIMGLLLNAIFGIKTLNV